MLQIKKILQQHQMRITQCRCDVLSNFLQSSYALSARNLEERLPQYDRVTLYRTLHAFIEKGILHQIPQEEGVACFGLSQPLDAGEVNTHDHSLNLHSQPAENNYYRNHIHFICQECGHTQCLSGYTVPEVSLPEGYQIQKVNLLVEGYCQSCQHA